MQFWMSAWPAASKNRRMLLWLTSNSMLYHREPLILASRPVFCQALEFLSTVLACPQWAARPQLLRVRNFQYLHASNSGCQRLSWETKGFLGIVQFRK